MIVCVFFQVEGRKRVGGPSQEERLCKTVKIHVKRVTDLMRKKLYSKKFNLKPPGFAMQLLQLDKIVFL